MLRNVNRVSFIIVSLKLLYDHYCNSFAIIRIKNPQFQLSDPYNSSEIESVNDVYDKLIDLKNFAFIINSNLCQNLTALLLVIIISSNVVNYDKRAAIRDTWGHRDESTKVVFLLGKSNNSFVNRNVEYEAALFEDIVQGNFIDAYRNMTYKHVMGLKWVNQHCPMAKYVLKTDDDVFVHTLALRHFLARELSPWGGKGLIVCKVYKKSQTQRSHRLKWIVTQEEYPGHYYPAYCAGFAVLYSHDVVRILLKGAQCTPYNWIDDIHVTGTLVNNSGLTLTSGDDLMQKPWQLDFENREFLFGRMDLAIVEIKVMWKILSERYYNRFTRRFQYCKNT